MGNHDLLGDDDFFEKSKPGKKDPKTKKDEVYSEEEDFLKSKSLDQDALDLEDIESSLQERQDLPEEKSFNLFEDDIVEQESFQKEEDLPEAAPVTKKAGKTKDDIQYQKVYFDAENKQEGINYKPFIIGIAVVIVLAVAGYFIYDWYMGRTPANNQTELSESMETPAPQEQQQQENQIDQRRVNFLGNIADRTRQELNSVSGIVSASSGDIKLSSILLYNSDLTFEVFGNSRENLARLNIKLKEKFKNQDFKIVSSSQRPGENGGIFGVYSASLGGTGSGSKNTGPAFSNGREADQWIQGIFSENKLKYEGVKSRKSTSVDMFTVYEIETTANGSLDACRNTINKIASAGSNIKIHKLICNALDQKDFSAGKYQLKLVIKIYA